MVFRRILTFYLIIDYFPICIQDIYLSKYLTQYKKAITYITNRFKKYIILMIVKDKTKKINNDK